MAEQHRSEDDGDGANHALKASLERLAETIQERQANAQAPMQKAKVIPLPIWPEELRGVPNVALRSALFGAIRRGPRKALTRVVVASLDGYEIRYTGARLDQADLDVWEQCLHLARDSGLGCRILFSTHSFLKAIHRSTGGKDVEWLKNAFARLASAVVEIKHGKFTYFGPMIQQGARDDETGQYVIEINPAIVALYGPDGWTQIDWEQRQRLKKQPLAQWLHGFYSSHAAPYPMKVQTLHNLSGSEAKQMFHFRAELRVALAKLESAAGWAWKIDEDDLVHIHKSPSSSQARHLERKSQTRTK